MRHRLLSVRSEAGSVGRAVGFTGAQAPVRKEPQMQFLSTSFTKAPSIVKSLAHFPRFKAILWNMYLTAPR